MLVEVMDKNGNSFTYQNVYSVVQEGIFIVVLFNGKDERKALLRAEIIDRLYEIQETKDGNKL